MTLQVKVQSVHVNGLGRSKDDFVSNQVKPLFKATNFEEVSTQLLVCATESGMSQRSSIAVIVVVDVVVIVVTLVYDDHMT